ncbi:hypothetical protein V5P93_003834 [Actinokineospora auranticolor]|uniref:hypothetical protein n=1 Tax=Actinokineospora auranticolor TaxID=155976 RepID=UPI0015E36424|nr:hypothetical protein [Actinokineospora auranticolor]
MGLAGALALDAGAVALEVAAEGSQSAASTQPSYKARAGVVIAAAVALVLDALT